MVPVYVPARARGTRVLQGIVDHCWGFPAVGCKKSPMDLNITLPENVVAWIMAAFQMHMFGENMCTIYIYIYYTIPMYIFIYIYILYLYCIYMYNQKCVRYSHYMMTMCIYTYTCTILHV